MRLLSTRLIHPALALALAFSATNCGNPKPIEDADASVATALTPIPAPAGLLADLVMGAPEATWQKARALVGGPAMFLPSSFGGLATSLLGLPITVAGELDGNVPAVGAIVDAPGEPGPHAALGLHARDGYRLVADLTKGEAARFTAHVDPATSITLLEPKGAKGSFALGVLGNYLLVAKTTAELEGVGPYVARTLSQAGSQASPGTSSAAPKEDLALELPADALGGPIKAHADRLWAAIKPVAEASGPATLLGSVVSISSGVEKMVGMLGDLRHARVTVSMDPGVVRARIDMGAKPGDGPTSKMIGELAGGDLRPVLDLPAGTLVALAMRETPASRRSSASDRADAFARMLGKDLPSGDRDAIGKAVEGLAEGRGDWMTAGFRMSGTGPAGYARGAVADADLLGRSIVDFVALAKLATAKQRLKDLDLTVSEKKTTVEKVGDVERIRFERVPSPTKPAVASAKAKDPKDPKSASDAPSTIDLYYTISKESFVAAVGLDAKAALVSITSAPEGKLDGPAVRAAVDAIGSDATFGVVVEPLAVLAALSGKPAPTESAPLALAFGRTKASGGDAGSLWLRLDVANADVQELMRRRGMF